MPPPPRSAPGSGGYSHCYDRETWQYHLLCWAHPSPAWPPLPAGTAWSLPHHGPAIQTILVKTFNPGHRQPTCYTNSINIRIYGRPFVPRGRMEWELNLSGGRHLFIWRPPHKIFSLHSSPWHQRASVGTRTIRLGGITHLAGGGGWWVVGGEVFAWPFLSVLLLGILKKGPDPARTFKKRANQNISGPHAHLMQNTLSISICAFPFYKKLL